ncbi:MAG: 50S ribosomal protein L3 [SAR202 cluster bacterium Io17-Chloro-G9]|nr:MAG: 50S ribosomal protein L3 [SAR202 cluster bacterium Io17-Chloro-G9]
MIKGFLGKKVGMSQVFREDGILVPVSVIEAGPCVVTQIKTQENDGYEAVQLGFGEVKRRNKPMAGHYRNSRLCRHLREVQADDVGEFQVGENLTVAVFQAGEFVDVIGRTKGRGFAGVMKRHGFAGGPRTHGQSDRARAPGSIGGGTTPGKVFKGLKMPGHMGNRRVTVKGLEVIQVDPDRNLLLLKGGVPGGPNGLLEIRRSTKPAVSPPPLIRGQTQQALAVDETVAEEVLDQDLVAEEQLEQQAEAEDAVVEETTEEEPEVQEAETMDSQPPETSTEESE